jgi:threonine/homoserine/homoserine lactone efflux protein
VSAFGARSPLHKRTVRFRERRRRRRAILVGLGAACAGASLGGWISRHRVAQTVQKWGFASLLMGFGAKLALTP